MSPLRAPSSAERAAAATAGQSSSSCASTAIDSSRGAPKVVIVSETLARQLWPGVSPIGKRVDCCGTPEQPEWMTIVGVVADEKQSTPFREMAWTTPPIVYRAIAQQPQTNFDLVVRGSRASEVQRELGILAPDIRISDVQTIRQVIARYLAYPQFRAVVLGFFAALGLLLAVVGLYNQFNKLVFGL